MASTTFYSRSKECLESWIPHSSPVLHVADIWREERGDIGFPGFLVVSMSQQPTPFLVITDGDMWYHDGQNTYHAFYLRGVGVVVPHGDSPAASDAFCAAALESFHAS